MSSDLGGPDNPPVLPRPPGDLKVTKAPKNPLLALILSFLFPGIGQAYNGQPAKAFVMFLSFAFSIYAVVELGPMPYSLFLPFVFFFNLVDAYRSADILNARGAGGTLEAETDGSESPAWGITLMALGGILLLHNLGWLDVLSLHRFWPLALIAFGAVFLWDSLKRGAGGGGR